MAMTTSSAAFCVPPNLPGGHADESNCTDLMAGETCIVSCYAGYGSDVSVYSCNTPGLPVEGTEPECGPCLDYVPTSEYVDASSCSYLMPGMTCNLNCVYGTGSDSSTMTCDSPQSNLSGTEPTKCGPCFAPPSLDNAIYDTSNCEDVPWGTSCLVSCQTSYMYDDSYYSCVDGGSEVEGIPPTCTSSDCTAPSLDTVLYDTTDCTDVPYGGFCTVFCQRGYGYDNASYGCYSEGSEVSGYEPSCIASSCFEPDLDAATYDTTSCTDVADGGTCTVTCQPGYGSDSSTYTCHDMGSAVIGAPPSCTASTSDCFEPTLDTTTYNTSDCTTVAFSSTCTVSCQPGYGSVSTTYTCLTAGAEVEGTAPSCSATGTEYCQPLTPVNTYVDTSACSAVAVGDTCTVKCFAGQGADTVSSVFSCSGADQALAGEEPTACGPCYAPASLDTATYDTTACADVAYGSSCTVACQAGYTANSSLFSCATGGSQVIGRAPSCNSATGTACSAPTFSPNVTAVDCSSVYPPTGSCTVECIDLSNSSMYHCLSDGAVLQGVEPTCGLQHTQEAETCLPLNLDDLKVRYQAIAATTSSYILCEGNHIGNTCSWVCGDGYEANSLERLVCSEDQVFAGSLQEGCLPKVCETEPDAARIFANSSYTVTQVGGCAGMGKDDYCSVGCAVGAARWEGSVVCENGVWSAGYSPSCMDATTPCSTSTLTRVPNGVMDCVASNGTFPEGFVCPVQCSEDYEMTGKLVCTDGTFRIINGMGCLHNGASRAPTQVLEGKVHIQGWRTAEGMILDDMTTAEQATYIVSIGTWSTTLLPLGIQVMMRDGGSWDAFADGTEHILATLFLNNHGPGYTTEDYLKQIIRVDTTANNPSEAAAAVTTGLYAVFSLKNLMVSFAYSDQFDMSSEENIRDKVRNLFVALHNNEQSDPVFFETKVWRYPNSSQRAKVGELAALTRHTRSIAQMLNQSDWAAYMIGTDTGVGALKSWVNTKPDNVTVFSLLSTKGEVASSTIGTSFWRASTTMEGFGSAASEVVSLLTDQGYISSSDLPIQMVAQTYMVLQQAGFSHMEVVAIAYLLGIRAVDSTTYTKSCEELSCWSEIASMIGEYARIQGASGVDVAWGILAAAVYEMSSEEKPWMSAAIAALAATKPFGTSGVYVAASTLLPTVLTGMGLGEAYANSVTTWIRYPALIASGAMARFQSLADNVADSPGDFYLNNMTTRMPYLTLNEIAIWATRYAPFGMNWIDIVYVSSWMHSSGETYASIPYRMLMDGMVSEDVLVYIDYEYLAAGNNVTAVYNALAWYECSSARVDCLGLMFSLAGATATVLKTISEGFITAGLWDRTTVAQLGSDLTSALRTPGLRYEAWSRNDALRSAVVEAMASGEVDSVMLLHQLLNVSNEFGTDTMQAMVPLMESEALNALSTSLSEEGRGYRLLDMTLAFIQPFWAIAPEDTSGLLTGLLDDRRADPLENSLLNAGAVSARVAAMVQLNIEDERLVTDLAFQAARVHNPLTRGRNSTVPLHSLMFSDGYIEPATADLMLRTGLSIEEKAATAAQSSSEVSDADVLGSFQYFSGQRLSIVNFGLAAYDTLLQWHRSARFEDRIRLTTAALQQVGGYAIDKIPAAIGLVVMLREGSYEAGMDLVRGTRMAMMLAVQDFSYDTTSLDHTCSSAMSIAGKCSVVTITGQNFSQQSAAYRGIQDVLELAIVKQDQQALEYLIRNQRPYLPPAWVMESFVERYVDFDTFVQTLDDVTAEANISLSASQAQGAAWFVTLSAGEEQNTAFRQAANMGSRWGLSCDESVVSAARLALMQGMGGVSWVAGYSIVENCPSGTKRKDAMWKLAATIRDFQDVMGVARERSITYTSSFGGSSDFWPTVRYNTFSMELTAAKYGEFSGTKVGQLVACLLEAGHMPAEIAAFVSGAQGTAGSVAAYLANAFLAQGFNLDWIPNYLTDFTETVRDEAMQELYDSEQVYYTFPSVETYKLPAEFPKDAAGTNVTSDWVVENAGHLMSAMSTYLSIDQNRLVFLAARQDNLTTSSNTGGDIYRRLAPEPRSRELASTATSSEYGYGGQNITFEFLVRDVTDDEIATIRDRMHEFPSGVNDFIFYLSGTFTYLGLDFPEALTGILIADNSTPTVTSMFEEDPMITTGMPTTTTMDDEGLMQTTTSPCLGDTTSFSTSYEPTQNTRNFTEVTTTIEFESTTEGIPKTETSTTMTTTTTTETTTTSTTSTLEPCLGVPELDFSVFDARSAAACANITVGSSCLVACAGSDSTCKDTATCFEVTCESGGNFDTTLTLGECQAEIPTGCSALVVNDFTVSMGSGRLLNSAISSESSSGAITCSGSASGSVCSVGCNDYYDVNTLQGLICSSSGVFSGSLSEGCLPKACINSPTLASLSATFGEQYSVSEKGCAGKLHGETCKLECASGTTLTVGYLQCTGNSWTMSLEPTCEAIGCEYSQIPAVSHGEATCTAADGPFTEGDVCSVQCDDGYSLSGKLTCHDGSFMMYGGLGCTTTTASKNSTTALVGSLKLIAMADAGDLSGSDAVENTLTTFETVFDSDESVDLSGMLSSSLESTDASAKEKALLVFSARHTTAMLRNALEVGISAASSTTDLEDLASALYEDALLVGLDPGESLLTLVTTMRSKLGSLSAEAEAHLLVGLEVSMNVRSMLYLTSEAGLSASEVLDRAENLTRANMQWDLEALQRPQNWQLYASEQPSTRPGALKAIMRGAWSGAALLGLSDWESFGVGSILAAKATSSFDSKVASRPSSADLSAALAGASTSDVAAIATLMVDKGFSHSQGIAVSMILANRATDDSGSLLCKSLDCFVSNARSVGAIAKSQGAGHADATVGVYLAVSAENPSTTDDEKLDYQVGAALAAASAFSSWAVESAYGYLAENYDPILWELSEEGGERSLRVMGIAYSRGDATASLVKLEQSMASSPSDYIFTIRNGSQVPSKAEVAIAARRALPVNADIANAVQFLGSMTNGKNSIPFRMLSFDQMTEEYFVLAERAVPSTSSADTYTRVKTCISAVFDYIYDEDSSTFQALLAALLTACDVNEDTFYIVEQVFVEHGFWTADESSAVREALYYFFQTSESEEFSMFFSWNAAFANTVKTGLAQAPTALAAFTAAKYNIMYEISGVFPMLAYIEGAVASEETPGGTRLDELIEAIVPYLGLFNEEPYWLVDVLASFEREPAYGSSYFAAPFVAARVAKLFKIAPYSHRVEQFAISAAMTSNPVLKDRPQTGLLWTSHNIESHLSESTTSAVASVISAMDAVVAEKGSEATLSDFAPTCFKALNDRNLSVMNFAVAAYDATLRCSRSFTLKERVELVTLAAQGNGFIEYTIPIAVAQAIAAREGTWGRNITGIGRAVRQAFTSSIALISIDDTKVHSCNILAEMNDDCENEALPSNVSTTRALHMAAQSVIEFVQTLEDAEAYSYMISTMLPFVPPRQVISAIAAEVSSSSSTSTLANLTALVAASAAERQTRLSASEAQGAAWFALRGKDIGQEVTFTATVTVGLGFGLSPTDAVLSTAVLAMTQAASADDVFSWVVAWTKDNIATPAWSDEILGLVMNKALEFEAVAALPKARATLSESIRSGTGSNWPSLRYEVLKTTLENIDFAASWSESPVEQLLVVLLEAGYTAAEAATHLANMDVTNEKQAQALALALIGQGFELADLPTLLSAFSATILSNVISTVEAMEEVHALFPSTPTSSLPAERRRRLEEEEQKEVLVRQDESKEDTRNLAESGTTATTTTVSSDMMDAKWAYFYSDHIVAALATALDLDGDQIYVTSYTAISTTRRLSAEADVRKRSLQSSAEVEGFTVNFVVTGLEDDDELASVQDSIDELSTSGSTQITTFLSTLKTTLAASSVTVPASLSGTVVAVGDTSSVVSGFELPNSIWQFEDFPACSCGPAYEIVRDITCSSGLISACQSSYYKQTNQTTPNTTLACDIACPITCPYGEDFFVECEMQVMATVGASVGLAAFCCCIYCVIMCRRPRGGRVKVNLNKMGKHEVRNEKGKVQKNTWSKWRLAGISGDKKEHIVWDMDIQKVAGAMGVSPEELQAELDLQFVINPDTEMIGREVDLGFAGRSYELTLKLETKSTRPHDFLCGKVFLEGDVPDMDEENKTATAKALLLANGYVVFETEAGTLASTTPVNDGKEHEVKLKFDDVEGQVSLFIDGKSESYVFVGNAKAEDHVESFWLTATSIEKASLEDNPSRRLPLSTFLGKISEIKYNGKSVVDPTMGVATLNPKGYSLACKEKDSNDEAVALRRKGRRQTTTRISLGSDGLSHAKSPAPYGVQARLEYFSMTHGQWVMCSVLNHQSIRQADGTIEHRHNLSLKSGIERLSVPLTLLRQPLRPGEPCSIYSATHGRWVNAFAARSQLDNPSMWGYRVYLEKDLDSWHEAHESHRHTLKEVGYALKEPEPCPIRKATSITTRRRFPVGTQVHVYKEQLQAWVPAKVLQVSAVDLSEYLPDQGEDIIDRADSRPMTPKGFRPSSRTPSRPAEDMPDVPIVWVAAPKPKDNNNNEAAFGPQQTNASSVFPPLTSEVSVASGVPARPELSRRSLGSRDGALSVASHRGVGVEQVPLALWEIATVQEEAGPQYVVDTYRLKMRPQDWGMESRLPPPEEEMAFIMKNAGVEVAKRNLTDVLHDVKSGFDDTVNEGKKTLFSSEAREATEKASKDNPGLISLGSWSVGPLRSRELSSTEAAGDLTAKEVMDAVQV